jgi:hypothetical protein
MSDQGHQGHYEIVEDFWRLLRAADVEHVRAARRRVVRRRQLRTLALAALLVLALAAVALAIKTFVFGSDAPRTFSSPRSAGIGAIRPGTVKLLSVRTPDPNGGPPWGMRVFSTQRGYGCYQVGRLVDGRLVALGINGAFGSDGRAHRLPVDNQGCGGTDDVGHLRFTAVSPVRDASAALTEDRCLDPEGARAARSAVRNAQTYIADARGRGDQRAIQEGRRQLRRARRAQASIRVCSPAALRVIITGAAGPSATTVELTTSGQHMTEHVSAADGGAFLFVLAQAELPTAAKLEARYADGRGCLLPDPAAHPHATRPQPGCEPPPGFVYIKRKRVR